MRVDVSDLMADPELGGTTFTRRRPTTTTLAGSEGESRSTYVSTTLAGIVQPAATADAKLLPEGVRLTDVQAFFTASDISAGDGHSGLPDVLEHQGKKYRVLHVQAFGAHGMTKALAQFFVGGGG